MSDERYVLQVIYEALGRPFPASGTQSASVRGLNEYAAEMREIIPQVRRVLVTLCGGESYEGELAEDVADLEEICKRIAEAGGDS